MMQVIIHLPEIIQRTLWNHLLPENFISEEAAFVYANPKVRGQEFLFHYVDWFPVPETGFEHRSAFHLELTDESKAVAIKRAHDLGASLIEFHSHKGHGLARFSPSDFLGFQEFVPHVWWRLKGQPYAAVVLTGSSFDGLAWTSDPHTPEPLGGVVVGEQRLPPTKLSLMTEDFHEESRF